MWVTSTVMDGQGYIMDQLLWAIIISAWPIWLIYYHIQYGLGSRVISYVTVHMICSSIVASLEMATYENTRFHLAAVVSSCQQCHSLCQCTALAFSNIILLPWAYLEAHLALVKDTGTVLLALTWSPLQQPNGILCFHGLAKLISPSWCVTDKMHAFVQCIVWSIVCMSASLIT
jgi:hypothetical protein